MSITRPTRTFPPLPAAGGSSPRLTKWISSPGRSSPEFVGEERPGEEIHFVSRGLDPPAAGRGGKVRVGRVMDMETRLTVRSGRRHHGRHEPETALEGHHR